MSKRIYILIIVSFLIGILEASVFIKDALSNQINYALISGIQEKSFVGGTRILIDVNRQSNFVTYELIDPSRIIIDPIIPVFCNLSKDLSFEKGLVSRVKIMEDRYAKPETLDKTYYPVDFIMLELRKPSSYEIFQQDHSILLEVGVSEEEVIKAMREWSEVLKKREWTFWSPVKKSKLTANITQDIEYNENFYSTNRTTKAIPKLVTKLYPEFWFGVPLSRDLSRLRLNIYYKPTLIYYNKIGDFFGHFRHLDYYINPSLVFNPTSKSSLVINNTYEKFDHTDILDHNIIHVYEDSWQSSTSGDFRYNFNNKNSLRLYYRFYMLQYPDLGITEKWDEMSQEQSSTLETRLNERTSVYLTGQLIEYARKRDNDSFSKKGTLGIKHRFFKTTDTETRVSFTTTDYFEGNSSRKDEEVLEALGTLSRPLTKWDSLYLTYSFTKGYYNPPYFKYYAYLSLSHRFPWKKSTGLHFTSGCTYEDFYLQTTNKKTLDSSFGLTRAVTKWLQTELWYSYSIRTGVRNDRLLNNRFRFLLRYIF